MISLSKIVAFTPAYRQNEDAPPVYHLRVGSVIERASFEAELAGEHRAGEVAPWDLALALAEGIAALLAEAPDRDRVLELAAADNLDELSADDRQLIKEVTEVISEHWPAYRALVAQQERRRQILPVLAFRRFCKGWENVNRFDGSAVIHSASVDGMVSLEALAGLPPMELKLAGIRAFNLLYGTGEAGNSARPSKSDDGQATSDSDDTSTAAGKSRPARKSSGKKTRGSRSRNGAWASSTSGSPAEVPAAG
jgi:hypothetical protein